MRTLLMLLLALVMLSPLAAGHAAELDQRNHEYAPSAQLCPDAMSDHEGRHGGREAVSSSCDADADVASCCPAAVCGAAAHPAFDRWSFAVRFGIASRRGFPADDALAGVEHGVDPPPPRT
jgi:hypothetical protein